MLTVLAAVLTAMPANARDDGWRPGEFRLPTPWSHDVSPDNALPEYPRPQLERKQWQSLNGVWEFAGATKGEDPPFGKSLDERVLVPYPVESALSGIQRHEDYMWYRRTVDVPKRWDVGSGQRLQLHFGAVDYRAAVYVNGHEVAKHQGGYGQFSADITDALNPDGPQEIVVGVEDRVDDTWQPVGKQRQKPDEGIFYEGASGIWQTVWLEPVADTHVAKLDTTPDIDTSTLALTPRVDGDTTGVTVDAVVRDGRRVVSRVTGLANLPRTAPVPDAKLWSPDHPFLYDLDVTVKRFGKPVDHVTSYFGMREIGMAKDAKGKNRITVNGKPTFVMSTLDQGYWPDGIYTAPTDEALRFDLEQHKELGFNAVRKHIKVEPDRWYYHADKLGLLVWQDMPSMRPSEDDEPLPPREAQQQFESELHEMVDQKKNWTSIAGWVPFNEGWGEWDKEDTGRIADSVKSQDPSRLVNAHSGVNCCYSKGDAGQGDVIDWHDYPGPAQPTPDARRVAIDGEHGGYGLEVDGHMWYGEGHAYEMLPNSRELTAAYVDNQRQLLAASDRCAVSGGIYTQITDVEHEVNGFFTYDRQVKKMDFGKVRDINEKVVREAGKGDGVPDDPGTPGLDGTHAYPVDEGSGNTTADSVGAADATLTGTRWVDGVRGGGLAFDGDGEADTGASLVDTEGSYSVSAWAKIDKTGDDGYQTVLSQDGDSDSAFYLQYSNADQRWAMSFVGLRAQAPTKPEPGKWYHLTGVRDANAGTLSLYVDGTKAATTSACAGEQPSGNTIIGRGQYDSDKTDRLHGAVDDVRVFDRALADDEVAKLAEGAE